MGGVNVQRSLHPQNHDEVPLSKALNQLLPGNRSINACPLLWVFVHGVCVCSLLCVCILDGLNAEHGFRVWVMSCHFHFIYLCLGGEREMTKEDVLRESSEGDSVLGRYSIISRNSERPVIHQVASVPMPSECGECVGLHTCITHRVSHEMSFHFQFDVKSL